MRNKIIKLIAAALFLFFGNYAHAAGYDFYVNANSGEAVEDGSESHPFKTIGAATSYISSHKIKNQKIFLKKGTYNEGVYLIYNASLFGEDESGTIIDANGQDYGVRIGSSKSGLQDVTVKNANTNLNITKKARAEVINCTFSNSDSNGVTVEKGSSRQKYKFVFQDSAVKDSGRRGMYIFRRRVEIINSGIENNEEEGIDLHTGVKGKIKNNKLSDNGEGGLELMVGGASLTISGNTISGNHSSGLAIQVYSLADGKITLSKNTIENNHKWGIRYVDFSGKKGAGVKFKKFVDKKVKLSGNTISGNNEGDSVYK